MGVTWAVEMRPEKEGKAEVDSALPSWGGFRVDGSVTRRITKLFPPDSDIWWYGETEARVVEPGEDKADVKISDVQGGQTESFPVIGTTTAKLLEGLANGDLSWVDEEDGEDRGDRYARQ